MRTKASMMRIPRARQRGAATLVVVMVLFLILAMMAAFANRNVIFEQRMASNYFRSNMAFEAAEAGVEWALARLNGDDIDGSCASSPGSGGFARRYLSFDADSGMIKRNGSVIGSTSGCIRSANGGLACTCPSGSSGSLAPPPVDASLSLQPMFGVDFAAVPRAGIVRMQVGGCTGTISNCTKLSQASGQDLGFSAVNIHVALISALQSPPFAPLTVRGDVALDGAGLGLHNADASQGGLVLQAGGQIEASGTPLHIHTVPGTPIQQAMVQDPQLANSNTRPLGMFGMFFGMSAGRYRDQPSVRVIACASDCGRQIAEAVNAGARQIWVDGDLVLASNLTLGSSATPILVIANGSVRLQGPMNLTGVIYARGNASWTSTSAMPSLLTGALLSEGAWSSSGRVDLVYSSTVLQTLSKQTGSFVRVPGSWKE